MDKGYNSEKWLLQFPHRSDNICMVGLVWQGQVHKTTLDHHLYWARTGSGETRGEQAGEPAGKLAQLSALCCVWRVCPRSGQIYQQAWVYILPRNPYLFYKTKKIKNCFPIYKLKIRIFPYTSPFLLSEEYTDKSLGSGTNITRRQIKTLKKCSNFPSLNLFGSWWTEQRSLLMMTTYWDTGECPITGKTTGQSVQSVIT